jgi:hypothetical protein
MKFGMLKIQWDYYAMNWKREDTNLCQNRGIFIFLTIKFHSNVNRKKLI